MKTLLFIPVYNCEKQIIRALEKLLASDLSLFSEIIIINNRSSDSTIKVVLNFLEKNNLRRIRLVTNSKNVNLGGTHKIAFQYAISNDFDYCVIFHGDDQGCFKDLESLSFDENSFSLGARFMIKSRLINYSYFRIFGNMCFNIMASFATFRLIYDFGGSGLNIFPIRLIKKHNFWNYSDDLTFHVYLLLNAVKLGQKVNFYPISWSEDDQISNVKLFSQTKKLFSIILRYIFFKDLIDTKSVCNSLNYVNWTNENKF